MLLIFGKYIYVYSMSVSFYVPILYVLWFDALLGPCDLSMDNDERPARQRVGAEKLASRVIKHRLVFKVEGKGAPVDLREGIGTHKLEEGRSGIGAKYVDLVAGALIEPSLKEQREDRSGDMYLLHRSHWRKVGERTLIQFQIVGKNAGALTMAMVWIVSG
jgi:hypothetical protein